MSELLGERIRRLRIGRGWSYADVAELMNTTPGAVKQWELRTSPRIYNFPRLAEVFEVSTDYLLTGREAPALAALHHAIRSNVPHARLLAMLPSEDR